jgi:site-specific recombinase XerD
VRALVETSTGHLDAATPITTLAGAWLASLGSKNTRAAYRRDLFDFLGFCHNHDVDPLAATRPVIDAYARSLDANGKAPATVARRLAALASFFGYLVDESIVASSPVDRVHRPRVAQESPRLGLDRAEAAALLAAAAAAGARDDALITLLLLNGLRVSEALSLDISDLDAERGHQVLHIVGKGGRRRTAPLAPRTVAAVQKTIGDRSTGPILLRDDGEAMNRHQAHRAVRRLARRAGITKTISPHSLRHTMVTLSLDAGVPIHVVQDAAGHASPDTTRRYDRARHALDGHATYTLAQHLAAG